MDVRVEDTVKGNLSQRAVVSVFRDGMEGMGPQICGWSSLLSPSPVALAFALR